MSDLKRIKDEFLTKLNGKLNLSEINEIRSNLFGKNGLISSQFKKLGSIAENERKKFASNLNVIKNGLQNAIDNKINEIQNSEKEIKLFLRTKMYDNKLVLKKNQRGKIIIKKLFGIIKSNPRKFLTKEQLTKDKFRAISDFISGMTDRYAINLYNNFK